MTAARALVALLTVAGLLAVAVLRRRQPTATAELDWDWEPRAVTPEELARPCGTCGAPSGKRHQPGCFWAADPMVFPPYPNSTTVDSGNDWTDHETCVPHDHVEPNQERWERDQIATLRSLWHEPEDGIDGIQPADVGLTMRLRGECG